VAIAVVLIAPLEQQPLLTAEMAATDRSMVIQARLEDGALSLTRIAGEAPAGRVLELWLIAADGVPVSLGVLPETAEARLAVPALLQEALVPGVTLAITDEPPGGAPGGVPTGTVLAAGPITQA
jgi:anti-sigma-K factor RskA